MARRYSRALDRSEELGPCWLGQIIAPNDQPSPSSPMYRTSLGPQVFAGTQYMAQQSAVEFKAMAIDFHRQEAGVFPPRSTIYQGDYLDLHIRTLTVPRWSSLREPESPIPIPPSQPPRLWDAMEVVVYQLLGVATRAEELITPHKPEEAPYWRPVGPATIGISLANSLLQAFLMTSKELMATTITISSEVAVDIPPLDEDNPEHLAILSTEPWGWHRPELGHEAGNLTRRENYDGNFHAWLRQLWNHSAAYRDCMREVLELRRKAVTVLGQADHLILWLLSYPNDHGYLQRHLPRRLLNGLISSGTLDHLRSYWRPETLEPAITDLIHGVLSGPPPYPNQDFLDGAERMVLADESPLHTPETLPRRVLAYITQGSTAYLVAHFGREIADHEFDIRQFGGTALIVNMQDQFVDQLPARGKITRSLAQLVQAGLMHGLNNLGQAFVNDDFDLLDAVFNHNG